MIKVNELFSGIGAFRKALERLEIPHEIVGISEIDKYAIKSYEAIYGETRNYGDISKVDILDYADLWTYGFPCQDISIAGQQKGIVKGETRSGLLYEVQRLLTTSAMNDELPKYLILENVKNLVSKKFRADFDSWLEWLSDMGYNNYWQVINAKDCGIPQNRERVFVVSIRKDVDKGFTFPPKTPLTTILAYFLEDRVAEKFYLSNQMLKYAFNIEKEAKGIGFSDGVDKSYINPSIARTIGCRSAVSQRSGTTNYVSDDRRMVRVDELKINVIGNYMPSGHDASRIVRPGGIAPTVKENHGTVTATISNWISEKGVKYICDPKRGMCTDVNADVAQTITAKGQSNWTGSFVSPDIDRLEKSSTIGSTEPVTIHLKNGDKVTSNDDLSSYRIRKLTPKECWRLMGFDDTDFNKAEKVCSNTQLYKQAGNSIVVNVLEGILKNLLQPQSRSEWLDELLGGA